jgi:hypothetical protein
MGVLFVISPGAGWATKLEIFPVCQQTPVWCWAAVGEMVFRYYDVPTINTRCGYQCGIFSDWAGLAGTIAQHAAYLRGNSTLFWRRSKPTQKLQLK